MSLTMNQDHDHHPHVKDEHQTPTPAAAGHTTGTSAQASRDHLNRSTHGRTTKGAPVVGPNLKRSESAASSGTSAVSLHGSLYQAQIGARKLFVGGAKNARIRHSSRRSDHASGHGDAEIDREEVDISVDPVLLDPYLLALSVTKFQPWVFIRELILHSFQPFLFFLLWTPRHRTLLYNRAFIGNSFGFYLQWAFFLWSAGCILVFVFDPPEHIGWPQFIIPQLLLFFRHVVIAFKYSFLSPIELSLMEEEVEPMETKVQRQVLSGWLLPSKDLIDLQVLLASARQWLDLTLGHFILAGHASHCPSAPAQKVTTPKPTGLPEHVTNSNNPTVISDLRLRYGAYLNEPGAGNDRPTNALPAGATPAAEATSPAPPPPTGGLPSHAPAWVVITELILEANKVSGFRISLRAMTIVYTSIPYFIRWYLGKEVSGGTRWTCWVYAFCEFWINWFLMTANLAFINVCVTDFRRREYLFDRLQAVLLDGFVRVPSASLKRIDPTRPGNADMAEEDLEPDATARETEVGGTKVMADQALPPTEYQTIRLCMNNCHNLLLWWYTRLIIQDYGRPYLLRLQTYTGSFIVFCLIIAVILCGAALGFFVVDTVGLVLCLCMVALMVVMVVTVLYYGLLANAVRQGHATMLYKKAITFSTRAERLRTIDQDESHDSRDAAQLCWILAQACQDDERVNSLKVFGLDCTPQLVTTFSTAMVAALSTGLQVFMRR